MEVSASTSADSLANASAHLFQDAGTNRSALGSTNASALPTDAMDGEPHTYDNTIGEILQRMHIGIIPIISLIGICGNAMAILLVRTNATLRRLPSNLYLAAMAASSVVFLWIILWEWAEKVAGWEHLHESAALCKTTTFLCHVCDFATAWLVVAVSVERMVVLYRFRVRHRLCTTAAARKVVAAVLLTALLANVWILHLASLRHFGNGHFYCDIDESYEDVYQRFLYVETLCTMIVPASIIVLTNGIVIAKLRYYRTFLPLVPSVRFRSSKDPAVELLPLGFPHGTAQTTETQPTTPTSLSSYPKGMVSRRRSIRPSDLRLTKTLLLITSLFICLNLPGYVIRIVDQVVWDSSINQTMRIVRFLCFALSYLHHGCLFYVYIFHSPQMKKQLVPMAWKLLECYCLKPVPDFGYQPQNY